ncbi:MAG: hypothetical protein EXR73_08225 [Myxococcales bacterium]|nr:hypothetical protein [Myxococcales bacterium]
MRLALALAALLLFGTPPVLARADAGAGADLLARARNEYQASRYQESAVLLYELLYAGGARSADAERLVAHKLLGDCYVFLGEAEKAAREYRALLELDPDHELDSVIDDPAVVDVFAGVRRAMAAQLKALRHERAVVEARRQLPIREVTIVREERSPRAWLNWVPFGAGQFKNGQQQKGLLVLGLHSVLGGASAGLYLYQAVTYGFPVGRRPPKESIDTVRTLQVIQVGTGALFLAAVAWAVFDAHAHTRPAVVERREERLVPQTGARLLPLLTHDAVGLAVGWEL